MPDCFAIPRHFLRRLPSVSLSTVKVFLQIAALCTETANAVSVTTSDLSAGTGLSRRCVFAAIAQLEEGGLIKREKEGPRGVNRYKILVQESEPVEPAGALEDADHEPCGASPPAPTEAELLETSERPDDLIGQAEQAVVPQRVIQESLDDFVGRVYRPGIGAVNLQRYILHCSDDTFRRALEWVEYNSHLSPDAPPGAFTNALLKGLRELRRTESTFDPKI